MDEEKETDIMNVVVWNVKNFTSWNSEIHPLMITSPEFRFSFIGMIELYPKGMRGCGSHLVVRVVKYSWSVETLQVTFHIPDGSVLCVMHVDTGERKNTDEDTLELPPGPRYDDVVKKIWGQESLYGDRLIIRCRRRDKYSVDRLTVWYREGDDQRVKNRATTTIETRVITLEISSAAFTDIINYGYGISWILRVSYPVKWSRMDKMNLYVVRDEKDESKLGLIVAPIRFRVFPIVWTKVSVMNHNEEVRSQVVEHVMMDRDPWSVFENLSEDEVLKKGFKVHLRMRIIPKVEYRADYIDSFGLWMDDKIPVMFSRPDRKDIEQENAKTVLSEDLSNIYQNRDFSDFQLKCQNMTFPVHKVILSARSPVFKTMLSNDMIETTSGYVDIGDIEPSTLAHFLSFLYTGEVSKEDLQGEGALNLYYVADKYQVSSLKKVCVDILCANLSVSNVCDILSLADRHQDDYLNARVRKFILENYLDVTKSEEWEFFSNMKPLLAQETLACFARKDDVMERIWTIVEEVSGVRKIIIYSVANKYEIPSLKKVCVDALCVNLSVSNVCNNLYLADRQQDKHMQIYFTAKVRKFILENYVDVTKSKEWDSFSNNEPLLAQKTLACTAKRDGVMERACTIETIFPTSLF